MQRPTPHSERPRPVPRSRPLMLGLAATLLVATGCAGASATQRADEPGSEHGSGSRGCARSATTKVAQPTRAHFEAAGLAELPVAKDKDRVDLVAQPFSNSMNVTNPLFPISKLHSVVLNGVVDGKAFRTETTLLADTRVIEWTKGQCVKTLVSQYVAYLDGRLDEAANDFYAQADDGSVWYLGEEVFNYKDGVVADVDGTWFAGKEGPMALIMPANPKLGNVNRPENIPGLVFEEVAISETGKTVAGPSGPIKGAIVGRQLHSDGGYSDKIFAPGYGEFYTARDGNVEALAVAVPTDTVKAPLPKELKTLADGEAAVFKAAAANRWDEAAGTVSGMTAAWKTHSAGPVPPRLVPPTNAAIDALKAAVTAKDQAKTRNAALDVAQAVLDLQLRYRPTVEIDRARAGLWARQILVDAAASDLAAVSGDVATLEWIRDRIARAFNSVDVTRIDASISKLRKNVQDEDLTAASANAETLRKALASARPAR